VTDERPAGHVQVYGHCLIMVEDIERSKPFYVDLLNFTVRQYTPASEGRAFLAFTQGIALTNGREPGHRQIDHIAWEVDDVRLMRDRLHAAGVSFFNDLHDGPYGLTVYVADPDGTKVELYQVGEKA
jgi:catechol 2,3-dioxygenase-like lactoylglutathione lyase family enzyme